MIFFNLCRLDGAQLTGSNFRSANLENGMYYHKIITYCIILGTYLFSMYQTEYFTLFFL